MQAKLDVNKRWIAVDWGTSNLRVWIMDDLGNILDRRSSDKGMGSLVQDEFEPAFLELAADFLNEGDITQVFVCGMAGAAEGWAEAGYLTAPCKPVTEKNCVSVPTNDPRISVKILPGVKQNAPPDVMRGEETQIAGFLSTNPDFEGLICLPGTHTKWVEVALGKIQHFQTFMTGEIFSFLTNSSVLGHIVSPDGWSDDAFAAGVARAMEGDGMPVAALFYLRAEALIADLPPDAARARLSGHLIGAELSATRALWKNRRVVILGDDKVAQIYRDALELQNANTIAAQSEKMTLAGLYAAWVSNRESAI